MLINLHRANTQNIGDLMSAPAHWFEPLGDQNRMEILGFRAWENSSPEDAAVWRERFEAAKGFVVGGGGLLNIDFFKPGLDYLFNHKRPDQKVVLWGAGHNDWQLQDWRRIKSRIDLADYPFDLVGVRDDGQGLRWVPCASCMSDRFDRTYEVDAKLGLYVHAETLANPVFRQNMPKGFKTLSNSASFDEAIAFLGSCEGVLTDSYHGAYWATLLGKKVIAFPTSSKFYDLRHPVPLCDPGDWKRYRRMPRAYPDALEDCRAANRAFAKDAFDMLLA